MLQKIYMFRHQSAIRRASFRSKEYKHTTPLQTTHFTLHTLRLDQISSDHKDRDICSYTYCIQNINSYKLLPRTANTQFQYHNVVNYAYQFYVFYNFNMLNIPTRMKHTQICVGFVHYSITCIKIQQDATVYQNFISNLYETQYVSGDTPPIIRSLKLHQQPLVLHSGGLLAVYTANKPPRMQNQRLLVQFQAADDGRCVARNMLSLI